MSRTPQRWRDDFLARMTKAGAPLDAARYLLRKGATLSRLAEAQCNGDWPADNGERKTAACTACEALWAPSVLKAGTTPDGTHQTSVCPDCRTAWTVERYLAATLPGWLAEFNGDPRVRSVLERIRNDARAALARQQPTQAAA